MLFHGLNDKIRSLIASAIIFCIALSNTFAGPDPNIEQEILDGIDNEKSLAQFYYLSELKSLRAQELRLYKLGDLKFLIELQHKTFLIEFNDITGPFKVSKVDSVEAYFQAKEPTAVQVRQLLLTKEAFNEVRQFLFSRNEGNLSTGFESIFDPDKPSEFLMAKGIAKNSILPKSAKKKARTLKPKIPIFAHIAFTMVASIFSTVGLVFSVGVEWIPMDHVEYVFLAAFPVAYWIVSKAPPPPKDPNPLLMLGVTIGAQVLASNVIKECTVILSSLVGG